MNEAKPTQSAAAPVTEETQGNLDLVIKRTQEVMKLGDRSPAEDIVGVLVKEALSRVPKWPGNVARLFRQVIANLDQTVSQQLAQVMHHPDFQKLEGTWRGLNYLVMNSETGKQLQIKVLNTSWKDLAKDFAKAAEFDQSTLFNKLYEDEFGTPGGEPYGALVGDYEFSNHPDDIELLQNLAQVSAAAFCPFLSAASPKLFGMDSFAELAKPRDLEKIFSTADYTKWRSFRESEDSRFVTLTMPRVLSRLPHGQETKPVEEFAYEEVKPGHEASHEQYCWMNAAYVLAARLTDAFAKTGWCTAIRGAENGGKVENLPVHVFTSDDGDKDSKCPTEIAITSRRDAELGKLGFLPLSHYKRHDYAVFFGGQTTQKPRKYDKADATANAKLAARLPYIMATSKIAHCLKIMGRDAIGKFMEASECQEWLNNWIAGYVLAAPKGSADAKAKFPLAEARIEVKEVEGSPGSYDAVAYLRPWLQMEELTASLGLVARIPQLKQ